MEDPLDSVIRKDKLACDALNAGFFQLTEYLRLAQREFQATERALARTLDAEPTHSVYLCEGTYCPFHNPSYHHMRVWRIKIQRDRQALALRVCPHGYEHPDPDSLAWVNRGGVIVDMWGHSKIADPDDGFHVCDGCCKKPYLPANLTKIRMTNDEIDYYEKKGWL